MYLKVCQLITACVRLVEIRRCAFMCIYILYTLKLLLIFGVRRPRENNEIIIKVCRTSGLCNRDSIGLNVLRLTIDSLCGSTVCTLNTEWESP